jgi:hypothetical protein
MHELRSGAHRVLGGMYSFRHINHLSQFPHNKIVVTKHHSTTIHDVPLRSIPFRPDSQDKGERQELT